MKSVLLLLWPVAVLAEPARTLPASETSEERRVATPLEGAVDAATYVVGPGDRLLVEAWGLSELTNLVEVNAEGSLFLPRIGVFAARGKILKELRGEVERRVRAVYPNLHVGVTLSRPRTFLVHVVGAVTNPGTQEATPLTRVSALVARAVPLPRASTRRVQVRREGDQLTADLDSFTVLGVTEADPTVLDGDTVFVPFRELEVEVSGAVRRPGKYELVASRDIKELMRLAGGVSADAARGMPVRVASRGEAARGVRSFQRDQEVLLHDGDHVHVPSQLDLGRTVFVEGAVVGGPRVEEEEGVKSAAVASGRAGKAKDVTDRDTFTSVPFLEGDGVRDLIIKVGGLQPWADARNAYLLRPEANGARKRLPVDLPAISSAAAPDLDVAPGDTLVVPSRRDQVSVSGAVQNPGSFAYNSSLTPADYITLAGGAISTGAINEAKVLRNGESIKLKKLKSSEPGDVISVPQARMTGRDWMTVGLTATSIVISAITLAITIESGYLNGTY